MNGSFHTMRSVLPTMIAQRYGKIVNVGGTFGMRGRAGRMAYSASKWGLRGITKSFALEVGQYNINVNCVAPGMVDGPRFRDKVCADMAKRLGISCRGSGRAARLRIRAQARHRRPRCRQCLPVSRQRRGAPDHQGLTPNQVMNGPWQRPRIRAVEAVRTTGGMRLRRAWR